MITRTILLLLLAGVSLVVWVDQRPQDKTAANRRPIISRFVSSAPSVTFCDGGPENVYCTTSKRKTVTLTVEASDPESTNLTYKYSVSAGEILGEGTRVTWKLMGQPFGKHTATVKVSDSQGAESVATVTVSIERCFSCGFPDPPCPIVVLESPDKVAHRGERLLVIVTVMPQAFRSRPDYNWTIEGGTVIKGDHTPMVEIEATGEIGRDLVATIDVEGLIDQSCTGKASLAIPIKP